MNTSKRSVLVSRLEGSLYGLAVGDALGAPYEFKKRGSYQISTKFEPISHFTHNDKPLPAGTFTDDTSLALCLAQSLNEYSEFNWEDAAAKMTRWYLSGYMSAVGECFDIGISTRAALEAYEYHFATNPDKPLVFSGSTHKASSGNGSLMRLAPIPIHFFNNPSLAIQQAALQSRITHGSTLTIESCQLATAQIIGFLTESEEASPQEKKDRVLAPYYLPTGISELSFASDEVNTLWEGTWKVKKAGEIKTSGYVIASHEAALWALWNTKSFEEGMLQLLAMGNDVDTVCAIYGQLAGACYGIEAIPNHWLEGLQRRDMLDGVFGPLISKAVETSNAS